MGQPTGPRNSHGVKFSSDCWRTVGGVRWPHWTSQPSDSAVAAYRAKGVRCRRVKQSGGAVELFIHPEDKALAAEVYEALEAAHG